VAGDAVCSDLQQQGIPVAIDPHLHQPLHLAEVSPLRQSLARDRDQ
jgi:hypothetical protein